MAPKKTLFWCKLKPISALGAECFFFVSFFFFFLIFTSSGHTINCVCYWSSISRQLDRWQIILVNVDFTLLKIKITYHFEHWKGTVFPIHWMSWIPFICQASVKQFSILVTLKSRLQHFKCLKNIVLLNCSFTVCHGIQVQN